MTSQAIFRPRAFIRPRWVLASSLSAADLAAIAEHANGRSGMKPLRLRRDLHCVDVCYWPERLDGEIHSVEVALIRDHPRPDLFPVRLRKFLTKKHRFSVLRADSFSVYEPYFRAI